MIFIRKSSSYWIAPGYSINPEGSAVYKSKKDLIMAVAARIGRDKPIYRDDFGRVALALAQRYSSGLGTISLLKSLFVSRNGVYFGCCYGRFIGGHRCDGFEVTDYDMEHRIEGDVCIISDFYTCNGCGKKKDGRKDPANDASGYDHCQWRIGGRAVVMKCCKKCRLELNRITRETKILAENKRLISQLQKEVSHHV